MVWDRVAMLRRRGHTVMLVAAEGSDFLDETPSQLVMPSVRWNNPAEASDVRYPLGYLEDTRAAYVRVIEHFERNASDFDLIENHSLHGDLLAAAGRLGAPLVTTLHTPPLPEMLAAHEAATAPKSAFLAVSEHTAQEWRSQGIESRVLPNAIDSDRWSFGSGGPDWVWFGRIVPEKGTHLAIQAARASGRALVIAGRIGDADYFDRFVRPSLDSSIRYVGALRQPELSRLVGRSSCALVTPMWDEPFGLVIAEALATGTPVAAFKTGGVPEVVAESLGARLVPMGDVAALADAARALSAKVGIARRRAIRSDAVRRLSLRRGAEELESFYRQLIGTPAQRLDISVAVPA